MPITAAVCVIGNDSLHPVAIIPQSVYLDYVGAILTRKNSHTGIVYRNDPTIFGWELAHAPRDPGHPGSSALEVS